MAADNQRLLDELHVLQAVFSSDGELNANTERINVRFAIENEKCDIEAKADHETTPTMVELQCVLPPEYALLSLFGE